MDMYILLILEIGLRIPDTGKGSRMQGEDTRMQVSGCLVSFLKHLMGHVRSSRALLLYLPFSASLQNLFRASIFPIFLSCIIPKLCKREDHFSFGKMAAFIKVIQNTQLFSTDLYLNCPFGPILFFFCTGSVCIMYSANVHCQKVPSSPLWQWLYLVEWPEPSYICLCLLGNLPDQASLGQPASSITGMGLTWQTVVVETYAGKGNRTCPYM